MPSRTRLLVLLPIVACAATAFGQSSWNAATGDFGTATNWTPNGVPGASTDVTITNGTAGTPSDVTISTGESFNNLNLAANNTLEINAIATMGGSTIAENGGTINLNGSGQFHLAAGTTTLSGGGTFTMGPSTYMMLQTGSGSITNVSSIISGAGTFGYDGLGLNNQGTVNANSSGNTLAFSNNGSGITNSGLMEATNSGTLSLSGDAVANGGGNITANGGTVAFTNGTVITGGTLNSVSSSLIEAIGTTTLDGSTAAGAITLNGTFTDDTASLDINGSIINNNSIHLPTSAQLHIGAAGATLTGGGTIQMDGSNYILLDSGVAAGTTLTNTDNTIQGSGNIGYNGMALINHGTINANDSGGAILEIYSTSTGVTNTNLLEATNGGHLLLSGDAIANAGGNITANGGTVEFNNGTVVTGGTLNSITGSLLEATGTTTLDGSTAAGAVTLNGTFTDNTSALDINGSIINNNSIHLPTSAQLHIGPAGATLTGGGTIQMDGSNYILLDSGVAAGTSLTNTDNTIQGSGNIGYNGMVLINHATIDANDSTGATLQIYSTNTGVTNTSLLEATNGGHLLLNGDTIANAGGNITANGGTVEFNGSAVVTGGTLNQVGSSLLEATGGTMLDGSTAAGTVTINGTFTDNATNLLLAGTITNQGNILMPASAQMDVATGGVTLTGGGTVTMGAGTYFRSPSAPAGTVLTNFNNTIEGQGTIGYDALNVNNQAAGTILANVSGANLMITSGSITNAGTLAANAGSSLIVSSTLTNFSSGTLTGGTYIATGTAVLNGTIQAYSFGTTGGEIVTNSATIGLNGPLSNLEDQSGLNALNNGVTGLTTNTALGTFDLSSNRVFTSVGDLGNAGNVQVSGASSDLIVGLAGVGTYTQTAGNTLLTLGGTLTAATTHVAGGTVTLNTGTILSPIVTNDSTGTITGSGTITSASVTNAGLIQAAGPALTLSNGVTGTTGTLEANQNSKLDLSGGINNSTAGTLELAGAVFPATQLALGAHNVTVSSLYTNVNFGTGNSFNNHANVTASGGQILAAGNAALSIVGTGVTGGGAAFTLPNFGNVHVGQTSTVTYSIENSGTTGPSVTGAIQTNNGGNITDSQLSGTGVTPANFGQLAIGGGTTTPYSVTYTGTTAGPLASGQTVHVASNFDNVTGPTVTLGSGAAYNYAAATALTTPVALGNVHVGQALGTTFSISNTAPVNATYTETLQGGVVSTTPVASASGSFTGLVAGAAPSTAISASLNTSNEGALSGTVTLGFNSQAVNNSGLGTTPLANQTVTLTGAAYQLASANSLPTSVALGNVHVGQTLGTTVNVSNTAPVNATYTETLGGSVTTTGVVTTSSSPNPLTFSVASGAAAAPVALNLNTNTAGALSGSGVFALSSNAVNGSGLGTTGLATQTVNLTGAAYNLAVASLGTLTFGNVLQNSTQTRTLTVSNSALASIYSEGLDASLGSFSGPSAGLLSNTGGTITNLAAGGSDSTTLQVTLNTSSTGAVTASVSVLLSSDGATTSGLGITPLTGQSVPITGMINANAVVGSLAAASAATPNPVVLGNVRLNATSPTQALTLSNTATAPAEGLNASFGSETSGLTGTGSFTSLAAGSTNSTSLVVGMNTSTAGSKNGSVTLALASDGTYNGGVTTPLASQTIPVTGAVYQPAVATLAPSTPTNLGTMRVGTVVNTGLSITNTAPATGGYTETLGATGFGTVSTGTPTVGTLAGTGSAFSGQAIGSPANTSLGVKFTASTPGSYNGSIPVNFETEAINGSGLGTASIGSSSASFTATVNAIANPVLSLTSGFTYNPTGANSGTLNFGTLTVGAGSGSVQSILNLENLITGNADALTGTFLTSTLAGTPFAFLDGTGATFNLGDDASSVFDITFNTTSTGFYTATLDINEASHNDSQSDLALPQFDLTIEGQINAAGVAGAPDAGATWLLVGVGLVGLALVRRWNCRAV